MLGNRIRDLRKENGLTLRQLATRIEVSPGLLSQIENGATDPSLTTIRKLAAAFGTSLAEMFSDDAPPVHITRPGDRPQLRRSGGHLLYDRLTPGRGDLEVLIGKLAPGEATSDEPWGHASTECTLVVDGVLTVEIGDDTYTLDTGESVTFDSRTPHRYVNTGGRIAEFVVSVTPPNP